MDNLININYYISRFPRDNNIKINEKDIYLFDIFKKVVINNFWNIKFYINYILNINSNHKIKIRKIEQIFIIKMYIIFYYNIFNNNNNNFIFSPLFNHKKILKIFLNKTIQMLYKQNIIDDNNVLILLNFLIELNEIKTSLKLFFSLYDDNNITNLNEIVNNNLNTILITIYNYFYLYNGRNNFLYELFEILSNFQINDSNYDLIKKIILNNYLFHYDKNFFNCIMKIIIKYFNIIGNNYFISENYYKKNNNKNICFKRFIKNFGFIIKILHNLIDKEYKYFSKDSYLFQKGFLIKSNINFNNIKLVNDFTILLNFKIMKQNKNINFSISLIKIFENNNNHYLELFIKNDIIIFKIFQKENKNEINLINFEYNNTYLLILTKSKNFFWLSLNAKNFNLSEYVKKFSFNKETKKNICFFSNNFDNNIDKKLLNIKNNNIKIIFGKLLLFNNSLTFDEMDLINTLKGNFYNIIYLNQKCNLKYDFDFNNEKNNIQNEQNNIKNLYEKKIKDYIIELNVEEQINQNYLIYNYLTLFKFIYFEGIKILEINCELIKQIYINNIENINEETLLIIEENINEILSMIEHILDKIDFEDEKNILLNSNLNKYHSLIILKEKEMQEMLIFFNILFDLLKNLKINNFNFSIVHLLNLLAYLKDKKNNLMNSYLKKKVIIFLLKFIHNFNENIIQNIFCKLIEQEKLEEINEMYLVNLILNLKFSFPYFNEYYKLIEKITEKNSNILKFLMNYVIEYSNNKIENINLNFLNELILIIYNNKFLLTFDDLYKKKFFINLFLKIHNIQKVYLLKEHKNIDNFNYCDSIKSNLINYLSLFKYDIKLYNFFTNTYFSEDNNDSEILLNEIKSVNSFFFNSFYKKNNEYEKLNEEFFCEKFKYLLNYIKNIYNNKEIKNINNISKYILNFKNYFSTFCLKLLNDLLSNDNQKFNQILNEILNNENYIYKYYTNYIFIDYSSEEINNFYNEIKNLFNLLLRKGKNNFVFNLMFTYFHKYKSNEKLKTIFINIFRDILIQINENKSEKINDYNKDNKIKLFLFFYQILSFFNKNNISNKNFYQNLISLFSTNSMDNELLKNATKLDMKLKINENIENNQKYEKYILEVLIEIYIEIYLFTNKENYLIIIENLILIQPENKESIFYRIDYENIKKLKKNEHIILLLIHYYIKFNLFKAFPKYFSYKILQNFLIKIIDILANEIKKLKDKKKLNLKLIDNNSENSFNEIYKKVLLYFINGEYKNKNFDSMLDELINNKENEIIYLHYFKYNYDKNRNINLIVFNIKENLNNLNKKIASKSYINTNKFDTSFKNSSIDDENLFDEDLFNYKEYLFEKENFTIENYLYKNDYIETNTRKMFIYFNFSNYFKNDLIDNHYFNELKKNYFIKYYYNSIQNFNPFFFLNYPTKIKNYFSLDLKIKMLLKSDLKFFKNELINKSHKNLINEKKYEYDNLNLFKNNLNLNNFIMNNSQENNNNQFDAEFITIEGAIKGKIYIIDKYFIFTNLINEKEEKNEKSENSWDKIIENLFVYNENDILIKNKKLFFPFNLIKSIYVKQFLFNNQSIEIYLKNNKSYYFNLKSINKCNSLINIIEKLNSNSSCNFKVIKNLIENFNQENYLDKYINNNISNFQFLNLLNFYSGRNIHNINNYYIFPWLSRFDNQDNKLCIRNFEYPMCVQNEKKRNKLIKEYEIKLKTNKSNIITNFNAFYSTSAFVIYYLIRLNPFNYNNINFQKGGFDHPDRIFNNFYEILRIFNLYEENRELIPEIFYFSEMYLNLNFNNFGRRTSDNFQIHNINYLKQNLNEVTDKKNIYFNNPLEFMIYYKKFLDSSYVKKELNHWIDFIFGVNQKNNRKNALNNFCEYCYGELNKFEIELEKIKNEYNNKSVDIKEINKILDNSIKENILLITNFGQTPFKILKSELKLKKIEEKIQSSKNFNNELLEKIKDNNKFLYLCIKENKYFIFIENNNIKYLYDKKFISLNSSNLNLDIFNIYNINNSFINILSNKLNVFIICNFYDNFLKLYLIDEIENNNNKNNTYENNAHIYIFPSPVTSIIYIKDENNINNNIITGLFDGKIIHFKIKFLQNNVELKYIKSIFTSNSPIYIIYYNAFYNCIITGDNSDLSVTIRNYETFEFLNSIKIKNNFYNKIDFIEKYNKVIDIKINNFNYFLYIITYNEYSKKYSLSVYTINGVKVCNSIDNISKSIYHFKNGKIIYFSFNENSFIICKGENIEKIYFQINLDSKLNKIDNKIFDYFYIIENEKIFNLCYVYKYNDKNDNKIRREIDMIELTDDQINKIYEENKFLEIENISLN